MNTNVEDTPYEMVRECHLAFNQAIDSIDITEDTREVRDFITLRKRLIMEEARELCDALEERDIEGIAKEECDLTYVSRGAILGIKGLPDPDAGPFRAVHNSNMSKLDDDGKPIKREDGKFLKSKNYRPADMRQFVSDS